MSHAQTPNACSEVARSQPLSASMSTSSQQYRSANPHSHYQHYHSNHDQAYTNYTEPWQDSNHGSYTGPSSVPLLQYPHAGLSSDFARPSQPPTPQTWNAAYAQPSEQPWNASVSDRVNEQSFEPRLGGSYDTAEGGASVQHTSNAARPYPHQHPQQASTAEHDQPLTSPDDAFRDTERFTALRITSESPATPIDPPFATHGRRVHSIPHPAHHAVSEPSAEQTHAVLQASTPWGTATTLAPTEHQHYASHANSALSSTVITSRPANVQSTQWTTAHTSGMPPAPPFYGHIQAEAQEWPLIAAIPEQRTFELESTQADPSSEVYAHINRRPGSKKKPAKVPSSYVERQEKMKVSKRKGPLPEKQREKTHTMRKTKRICVRCRFYKSGCDEGDPCQKCSKIEGHARSFREPCYREHLEDTSIIRRCNGREQQEEAEFLGYDWKPGSQLWDMDILWNLPGYGRIPNAMPMRVAFRPYSPRRGRLDTASSVWTTKEGDVYAIEQPAYAIYDTASLVTAFERYFSSLQPAIEAWIFDRIQNDKIATQTYREVFRMRSVHGSRALDLAMRLQCLSVVSQGYGTVWSNDIPGIREYDYRRLGRSGYEAYDRDSRDRPLPGAITHQMDVAAVKYLRKLEKLFVKELASLIFKPKIKPWYELFLTFYIIFWNLEYINQGAKGYMKSKNGTLIEHSVNNVVSNQVKKWEFAFPVLLYHWRCTLRGYSPFKLARDNPEELRERGHIDAEGFAYVTEIARIFDRQSPDRFQPPLTGFSATHHSFSSEWITQLFKEAGA
ncbi:hypothetical protein C7974DRAFT_32878 [Boeremia exigua]|uniref:uncharacterized protein n=1 Tax=Boeremia exigua TaxID=749465 RepID=UPI001E8D5E20|nr:uncharacterized protein C7974DRAFT_32878 [Boeremia exigua]KAH6618588.1 hypothetical protein C7974DRAFT_32878 [Boeremia exigua]